LDIADTVDPLELLLQHLIDIGGKLSDRFLTRKVQPHNRRRIGIDLGYPGFIDVLGKLVSDQGDFFPDILDGEVNVPLQDELHRDSGIPSVLLDVMDFTPLIVLTAPSSLSVISTSMTSGLAPFRWVEMVTIGKSTLGKRSTPISG